MGQILPGNLRRNPLIALGFLLLFVVAAYKASGFILAGDMTDQALVTIAVVISGLVVAILKQHPLGQPFQRPFQQSPRLPGTP